MTQSIAALGRAPLLLSASEFAKLIAETGQSDRVREYRSGAYWSSQRRVNS
jgi:hypothetical protein